MTLKFDPWLTFRPHLRRVWHKRTARYWWQVLWVVRIDGKWFDIPRDRVPHPVRWGREALAARIFADWLDNIPRHKIRATATKTKD